MRLELAQYREMAAFAQFGSDLDKATQAQLFKGERLVEILKQDQYQPLPVEKQVAIIYAANKGYLDSLPVSESRRFESQLYRHLDDRHPGVLSAIREKKVLDEDLEGKLKIALDELKTAFAKETQETAA
jgi:F-type H+-transporting ATPase subunit alpha